MSVTPGWASSPGTDVGPRLIVVSLALLLVGAMMALLAFWLAPAAPPPPPPRNPFGVGAREAAPAANAFGAFVMQWQASFYRQITASFAALKESPAALPALLSLGFAYGVVHAAGPGHGKAVISAYILSDDRSAALRGFGLSLGAALIQALVAIALVAVFSLLLNATARSMNAATRWVELASFAAVALLGLALLWRKSGVLLAALRGEAAACEPGCGHELLAAPPRRSWREQLGVMAAAGIRPCAGAVIVLVFALSQKLAWAGVATTFAMALGTALTTGAIALLAVGAKGLALRLAGGRGQRAAVAVRSVECLAAAFVAALGAALLSGLWSAGLAS